MVCVWNKRLNLALDISLIRPVDSNFDPNLFCSSQGCFLKRSIVCLPSKAMAFSRRFFVAVHDLNNFNTHSLTKAHHSTVLVHSVTQNAMSCEYFLGCSGHSPAVCI